RHDTGIPGGVSPCVFANAPDDAAYAAAVIERAGRVEAEIVGGVIAGAIHRVPNDPWSALGHRVGRIIGSPCHVEQARERAAAREVKAQHLVQLRGGQQGGQVDVGASKANDINIAQQRLGYALVWAAYALRGELWLDIDPVRTVAIYRVS